VALVVLMRAVNVGGHQKFKPAVLARELSSLGVTSLGAAGTFVVRGKATPAEVRKAFLAKLPFEPGMTILAGRDVLALVDADPFARVRAPAGARAYVSVLAGKPTAAPKLPLLRPAGDDWQVRVFALEGPFALSLARRGSGPLVYPNEVVEAAFGVPATTRNWDTLRAIATALG
jgi:uncharacterized protein (DUF1697 family)